MVEVNRVADAFREGRLSMEQTALIMQEVVESPLMTTIIASAAEQHYLDKSGLNDEERAEARVTLQRFLRGSIDGKINEQTMDAALSHVATKKPDGSWEFREKVSDEELRAFLGEAKRAADEAEIAGAAGRVRSVGRGEADYRRVDERAGRNVARSAYVQPINSPKANAKLLHRKRKVARGCLRLSAVLPRTTPR